MVDLEFLIEKNRTSDRAVTLNVGGTRFEVNQKFYKVRWSRIAR